MDTRDRAHQMTGRLHGQGQGGSENDSKKPSKQPYSGGKSRHRKLFGVPMEPATLGALGLSVMSSVSIVLVNKYLITTLGFNFVTVLTSWHMIVTFLCLHAAKCCGAFTNKHLRLQPRLFFSVLNSVSIALLNLCLGYNSVGFYQMTKLAIIPFTVVVQTFFYAKTFRWQVKMALLVLLLGVGVATVTDLELNLMGCIVAALAIISTCLAQILTNTIQKVHSLSSTQLLYQSSPFMALTLMLLGPPVDHVLTGSTVFEFQYNATVTKCILASCLVSVLVNMSTFLVLGKTSPVTYQVLGHVKTCLVLMLGFWLFKSPWNRKNATGLMLAIVGMIMYTHTTTRQLSHLPLLPVVAVLDRTHTQAQGPPSAAAMSKLTLRGPDGSSTRADVPLSEPLMLTRAPPGLSTGPNGRDKDEGP
eukprot:jgi/Mesvir1/4889/Mv11156-RA.1